MYLLVLPYWDATRQVNLDIMHNLILGAIKDHATHKLRLPEKSWKAVKTAEQNTSTSGTDYHDGDTSSSNEEGITASELRNLRRDASKGTPHPYKPGLIPTTPFTCNTLPPAKYQPP